MTFTFPYEIFDILWLEIMIKFSYDYIIADQFYSMWEYAHVWVRVMLYDRFVRAKGVRKDLLLKRWFPNLNEDELKKK